MTEDWLPWIILTTVVGVPCVAVPCFVIWSACKPYIKTPVWKSIPLWARAVLKGCIFVGILADALYNFTIASYRTWEWPRRGEWLLTDRLQRYRKLDDRDVRKKWAVKRWSWINLFDEGHW